MDSSSPSLRRRGALIPSAVLIVSLCFSLIAPCSSTRGSSISSDSTKSSSAHHQSHPHQSPSDLIRSSCKPTQKPSFCRAALAADNRTATVSSVPALAAIALDLAVKNTSKSMLRLNRDLRRLQPKTRVYKIARTCVLAFRDAIGSFRSSLEEIKEGEYETANYDAKFASDDAAPCGTILAWGRVRNSSGLWKMQNDVLCFSDMGFQVTINLGD